jgi:hypothetical protein
MASSIEITEGVCAIATRAAGKKNTTILTAANRRFRARHADNGNFPPRSEQSA